jgi:Gpi18-like mannosyltransferase
MEKYVPRRVTVYGGFAVLILLAIGLRLSFLKWESGDYTHYLSPWYDHLRQYGFQGFRDNFANYNLPYLYLLYFAVAMGLPKLLAIKLISLVFDLVLAYAVYRVIKHFRPEEYAALLAATLVLFLPAVFLNSAAWGQCDAIYTSFLLFSFLASLKKRPVWMWVFWAVAFSFKLQAVFFLPFLAYLWITNRKSSILTPLTALPIFIIPFVPALIAGRSFGSIASIYISQTESSGSLTLNAPNFYQWIPNSFVGYFNRAGILLTAAVVVLVVICALEHLRPRLKNGHMLVLATLFLFVVPFFLPQMHERYFYPAEVFSLLVAFAIPRFAWIAVSAQLVALFAYTPFLFRTRPGVATPPIPLTFVAVVQLVNIVVLCYLAFYGSPVKVSGAAGYEMKEDDITDDDLMPTYVAV